MALSMEAFSEASRPCRPGCSVRRLLDDLSPRDRGVLIAALGDKGITHAGISAVLAKNGRKLAQDAIGRHRRGDCSCARR